MRLPRAALVSIFAIVFLLQSTGSSQTVTITVRGTIYNGGDNAGIFGTAGAPLKGEPFVLIMTFDGFKAQVNILPPQCNAFFCVSQSFGQRDKSPGTAVLSIKGKEFVFGTALEAGPVPDIRIGSNAAKNTANYPDKQMTQIGFWVTDYQSTVNIGIGLTRPLDSKLDPDWRVPLCATGLAAGNLWNGDFEIHDSHVLAKGYLATDTLSVGDGCPSVPVSCQPLSSYMLPNFDFRPQQMPNWCWAANGQMAMNWVRPIPGTVTQCREVNAYAASHSGSINLHNADCCNPVGQSICNIEGWPEFEANHFDNTPQPGPLAFDEIKKEISCAKRPILFTWIDKLSGDAHMRIIVGYSSEPANTVEVYDPAHNSIKWLAYSTYANGNLFWRFGTSIYKIADKTPTQVAQ
jgi:hypothetical protein